MILSLITISLFMAWLAIESKFFTIRLLQYSKPIISQSKPIETVSNEIAQDNDLMTDNSKITAVYEPCKGVKPSILLIAETCSLTKFHKQTIDWKNRPKYSNYKDSFQTMTFDNHIVTLNNSLPDFYERLSEVKSSLNSKVRATSIKTAPAKTDFIRQVRTGSHNEWVRWNNETNSMDRISKYKKGYHHRIAEENETVVDDCLCGKDWLEAHANFEMPEPLIEITINDKELHLNGDYKKGKIELFMQGFTHKERAGKKGLVPVMNGEHLEKVDDNLYFACKDGEHLE
jgi:hypothetical protein